jgi:flagellar basal-body rod protein FlgG
MLGQAASPGSPAQLPGGASYTTATHQKADFSPGAVQATGNPLDMTLSEGALFAVKTPRGERYTRAGSFTRDSQGQLATPDGMPAMGENGPIKVDGDFVVSGDGTVSVGGETRGKLKLVQFKDPSTLRHEGGSLWASATPAQPAPGATVRQGYIEGSNVNPVEEMIDMVGAFRSYEANIKSAQMQNDSLTQLFGNVGRR